MATVTVELPESIFSALCRAPDEFVQELRIEAATRWYAQQRISREKGAEIAGISRAEFIDELARDLLDFQHRVLPNLNSAGMSGNMLAARLVTVCVRLWPISTG